MKPSSAWRTAVASESMRLTAELDTAVAEGGDLVAGGVPADTAREAIGLARAAAAGPARPAASAGTAGSRPGRPNMADQTAAARTAAGEAQASQAGDPQASQAQADRAGPPPAATTLRLGAVRTGAARLGAVRLGAVRLGAVRPLAAAGAGPLARLRDWWSGSSIETAWQSLHLAAEQLMLLLPDEQVRAMVPGAADRRAAQQATAVQHAQSDAQHQQVRGLRNITTVLLAVVLALDVALWAAGATTGVILGLGALGGALSVVFAVRAGTPPGPYNVLFPQSILKLVSGAATALMAVKILDFAAGVPASTGRDATYAVIFGFAQQMFTRLVDQRAGTLARVVAPREALPGSGPAPLA
jgi:hypothetical protein